MILHLIQPLSQSLNSKKAGLLRTTALSKAIVAGLFMLVILPAQAANEVEKLLDKEFWGQLYKNGGETFYTGVEFKKKTALITYSYVYPASLIRDHLDCGSNRQCLRKDETYRKILSDLHNVVPENSNFAFKLKSSVFGELGDSVEPDQYGIKLRMNQVDPTNERKGDIARIIYYMHDTYGLPMFGNERELASWNQLDPPSEAEAIRNDKISDIQGTRNTYVDNPERIQ